MTDEEFDTALVGAAFSQAAAQGWRKVSAGAAARQAGLDLDRARLRFPLRTSILLRFGALADAYALRAASGSASETVAKDRLFDLLMRRFDFLQQHRAGVLALMKYLPLEPVLAGCLARQTLKSMGWMLEGAGVSSRGLGGAVRKRGLMAVWAWGMRAWMRDESDDLSATMAAVDTALNRAESMTACLRRPSGPAAEAPIDPNPPGVPPAGIVPGA